MAARAQGPRCCCVWEQRLGSRRARRPRRRLWPPACPGRRTGAVIRAAYEPGSNLFANREPNFGRNDRRPIPHGTPHFCPLWLGSTLRCVHPACAAHNYERCHGIYAASSNAGYDFPFYYRRHGGAVVANVARQSGW